MSTERLSFNFNSLIPETYKSKAEAFAKCLQHKLLSLGRLETSSDSFEPEAGKRLSDDGQQGGSGNFESRPESPAQQAAGEGGRKKNETSQKIEKTEDSDEEFCSHSESETGEFPERKKQAEAEKRKQKLPSMSSEDSTVDSWSSCQENLTDFEKLDSENEEVNHFASQIKGSPKLRNFNIRCKRKENRDKPWKRNSRKNHSSSAESVDSEGRGPKHNSNHPMENFDSESPPRYILLDGSEEDEVPHRILRESSSTSSLEKHFSRSCLEEVRDASRNRRTQRKGAEVLTPPPSPERIANGEKEDGTSRERAVEELTSRVRYAVASDFEGVEFDEVECMKEFSADEVSRSVERVGGVVVECSSDNRRTDAELSLVFAPESLTVTTVEVFEGEASEEQGGGDAGGESVQIVVEFRDSETKPPGNVEEDDASDSRSKLRRCSSLKTWKTPPGTPGAKKIVRFADALGLDLADVRTFLDEIPKVPSSAYEDLRFESPASAEPPARAPAPAPAPTLVPRFRQPGGQMDFLERVQHQKLCLESALVTDAAVLAVSGCVRVQNMSFHKSVHVRYSSNDWRTFSDLQASYVPNSCDGFSDKFSFVLYGHALKIGERLEFALRLDCCGSQYWDNNGGTNYAFDCLPRASLGSIYSSPYGAQIDPWFDFY